jgi:hypothetical protein
MATPVRADVSEPERKPTHRIPEDALPEDIWRRINTTDPVDPEAALAWLEGRGPDPWRESSKR